MAVSGFPKWSNLLRPALGLAGVITPLYVIIILNFGFSPKTTDVGYQPEQPIPYSHALHAGQLDIDCEYCHFTVTRPGVGHSAVPPTETCMNCHHQITRGSSTLEASPDIALVVASYQSGKPIEWVRVHDLPDYCYFNHSAHINVRATPDRARAGQNMSTAIEDALAGDDGVGIGCESCHGRVDTMDKVWQVKDLSMAWCLDCHRRPEDHLRPRGEVSNMQWFADIVKAGQSEAGGVSVNGTVLATQKEIGLALKEKFNIQPSQDCSTCHR